MKHNLKITCVYVEEVTVKEVKVALQLNLVLVVTNGHSIDSDRIDTMENNMN